MGSGNWIVDNLNSALATWNDKLTEIWTLISTSPEEFKGGGIWNVILDIHDALRAIGYALLVLFFVAGVVKTCGSFTELKRPEVAVKTFVRFALAQGAVTYGLELMMTLFSIAQGAVSTIMDASVFSSSIWRRLSRPSHWPVSQDSPPAALALPLLRVTPPSVWRAVSLF